MPAGIGAVTTPPGTYGFAALFLLSGAMELAVWTQVRSSKRVSPEFCKMSGKRITTIIHICIRFDFANVDDCGDTM